MRRLALVIVALATLLSATISARAQDALALLARNKAFNGWSFGDPSMAGLRLSGTSNDGTLELVDIRRGALWLRTLKNTKSGLTTAYGFTGQRFWASNENGFLVPLIGDGAKYRVSYSVMMNAGIPLLKGTLHGSATVDGSQTQIVRADVPYGFPIDAYIERTSGRLVRVVVDPEGLQTTIDILGYTAVDGKQVISKWRIERTTTEMTKIERATLAADAFMPPQPTAQWTFGPEVGLPLTITDTRIFFEAYVNGAKGRFALDSGASGIALNADFADRAKLSNFSPSTSFGLNGEVRTSLARAESVQIGPHILRNVVVATGINVHGSREDFDGLFGFDFLAGAIIDIDMTQKKMAIYDPAKVDVTANGVTVLADLTSGIPTVPATFEGRVKAHLAFDTGDPMSVVATDELYGPRKVSMRVEGYTLLSGAGGTSRERAACGHVTSIELGPVKYDNVPACFGKIALFGHDAGIIGFDFLKHFNLTFDYPESKLYLTPTGK